MSTAVLQSQEDGNFAGTFADFLDRRELAQPDMLLIDADADLLAEEEVRAAAGAEKLFFVCRRCGKFVIAVSRVALTSFVPWHAGCDRILCCQGSC